MATWLFRKNEGEIESILIDAKYVPDHINGGWCFDKESLEETDESDLTPTEIRELAKDADIEGWETKRINTLKSELGI